MPTEREHSRYNDLGHDTSKYKTDSDPSFRLKFLQAIDLDPVNSPSIVAVSRLLLYGFAIYGFISLFF